MRNALRSGERTRPGCGCRRLADTDLLVRIDGAEAPREPLVNKDGLATPNDEIDREFTVAVPAGRHTAEIAHTGTDWVDPRTGDGVSGEKVTSTGGTLTLMVPEFNEDIVAVISR